MVLAVAHGHNAKQSEGLVLAENLSAVDHNHALVECKSGLHNAYFKTVALQNTV